MNWADWAIVAILVVSILVGLWRGLVREAISLVVWVVAIALAVRHGGQVAVMYGDWIELPSARVALGYATVFVLVLIVGGLVGWLIGRIVQGTGLGGTDRVLGLGFGLLRGAVVVAALILVLGYTPFPRDPWWHESRLIPQFQPAATWLREQIPETMEAFKDLTPPDEDSRTVEKDETPTPPPSSFR